MSKKLRAQKWEGWALFAKHDGSLVYYDEVPAMYPTRWEAYCHSDDDLKQEIVRVMVKIREIRRKRK